MANIILMYAWGLMILNIFLLGLTAGHHGRPKTGNENFWASFIATIITLPVYLRAMGVL